MHRCHGSGRNDWGDERRDLGNAADYFLAPRRHIRVPQIRTEYRRLRLNNSVYLKWSATSLYILHTRRVISGNCPSYIPMSHLKHDDVITQIYSYILHLNYENIRSLTPVFIRLHGGKYARLSSIRVGGEKLGDEFVAHRSHRVGSLIFPIFIRQLPPVGKGSTAPPPSAGSL